MHYTDSSRILEHKQTHTNPEKFAIFFHLLDQTVSTETFLPIPNFMPSIPSLLGGGNYAPTANRPPAEIRIIMLYRHSLSLLPLALQTPHDKFYQRDTIKRHH